MSKKIVFSAAILICSCLWVNAQTPKLKKAFNGKNLKGWAVPENNIWWSANDGVLTVKNGPDKKGSILWTEKEYENFIIETDFLFGEGTVDSGIFLRTDSQQIQLGISGSLKRDMTCSPYIAGKGYPVEASNIKQLLKQEDWNTVRIQAVGNLYTVWLNGEQVLNYESENAAAKGPLGLQLHANRDMAIHFRNIKIGKLP
ncbi:DUF1080 domain-containing protein [Fulvivirgaceae bacterium BMA10]|uniref:DUF1080 domain-containing protein n=1 Tax=Splendidivirga corallicola TaxID=3051826 RepID=A0ABT8KRL1_9BACT|nr:DUF1080 domain-containing protein [Fulvivirgaceae bacterium BMA10]